LAPLDTTDVLAHLDEFSRGRLHAHYERSTWDWTLDVLHSRASEGVECIAVHDNAEGLVGWFVYTLSGRGPAFVYQLIVRRRWEERVLDAAVQHAGERGAVTVQGRFDRGLMEAVRRLGGRTEYHGRGILLRTRDSDVLAQVLSGSAAFTGMDGEWWMGF
jgi:hypothetical protein